MPLPSSVTDALEFQPVTDIALYIIRQAFPDLEVYSEVPFHAKFPFVLVRRGMRFTAVRSDERAIKSVVVDVHCYTAGEDGDLEAEQLSEAIRAAMSNAWRSRLPLPEGWGSLIRIAAEMEPIRAPDWATSTGPVQYADLPTAAWRWEASYRITYRRPRD